MSECSKCVQPAFNILHQLHRDLSTRVQDGNQANPLKDLRSCLAPQDQTVLHLNLPDNPLSSCHPKPLLLLLNSGPKILRKHLCLLFGEVEGHRVWIVERSRWRHCLLHLSAQRHNSIHWRPASRNDIHDLCDG